MLPRFEETLQQERAEVWEGGDSAGLPDVSLRELQPVPDVRISLVLDQRGQRFGTVRIRFYLKRQELLLRPYEEVLLQLGIFSLVVIERVALLDQRLGGEVLIQRAFVNAQVAVGAQILLRFVVQRGDQQSGVCVPCRAVVSSE